jgi:large repetitive protein
MALGRSNDLHGTIWAGQLEGLIVGRIGSDFQTNVDYCPPAETSDLSIVKRASRTTVQAGGGRVMYALVVRNRGPADDPDVRVTDPMAAGLTLTSARSSQGSCSTANNTVSCDLGALRAGGAAVVLVTATTTGTPGCITNTARVEGKNPDPKPDNHEDSAEVCVPPPPPPSDPEQDFDLRVTKVANDRSVVVGEPVLYRVVVTNDGPAAAPDVVVADALNALVSVVDVRTTQGSCGWQARSSSVAWVRSRPARA